MLNCPWIMQTTTFVPPFHAASAAQPFCGTHSSRAAPERGGTRATLPGEVLLARPFGSEAWRMKFVKARE